MVQLEVKQGHIMSSSRNVYISASKEKPAVLPSFTVGSAPYMNFLKVYVAYTCNKPFPQVLTDKSDNQE